MMKFNTSISPDRLHEVLCYDPETGVFTWRIKTCQKVVVGAVAGSVDKKGRRTIRIDGVLFQAYRLAHLFMTGVWPSGVVDHKDTDPGNDRWDNLRDVSVQLNQQNRRLPQANGTTGFLGVTRDKRRPGFISRIKIPGRKSPTHLGQFSTAEDAHAAYVAAKRQFHAAGTL